MSQLIKPLDVVVRVALHQARVHGNGYAKKKPNWRLAMDLFICGSTAAYEYCELAGVDPEGQAFQLWPYKSKEPQRGPGLCCEIDLQGNPVIYTG